VPSSYTHLLYHLVFSTKDRRPLITPELRAELYPYIGGIIRNKPGILLDIGGMPDHVHLVARLRPDIALAEMLCVIKANSSKWANERRDLTTEFAWQKGYGAFTVSESQLAVVRHYVQMQEEHHRKQTFQEEFVALLKKHGIEYDERYLWE
jgi:REP element-mobilizing transposase RayT